MLVSEWEIKIGIKDRNLEIINGGIDVVKLLVILRTPILAYTYHEGSEFCVNKYRTFHVSFPRCSELYFNGARILCFKFIQLWAQKEMNRTLWSSMIWFRPDVVVLITTSSIEKMFYGGCGKLVLLPQKRPYLVGQIRREAKCSPKYVMPQKYFFL